MTVPYLKMEEINKSFPGVQALKDVSFDVCQGEILALIGANGAGKSTLMNVLGGNVIPDEGKIIIDGNEVKINSPLDAERNGVAFVHQEMAMLPTMSIADTMFISDFPYRNGFIDYKTVNKKCSLVLKRLGCNYDPSTKIRDMSPGSQQLVEIGRALLRDPKIIIFDEPTSSLSSREKEHLFKIITSLKNEGAVIIYISHMLDEVFRLCDRAVVLRNGETVGEGMIADLTYDDIVKLMIGSKQIDQYYKYTKRQIGKPTLKVDHICRKGVFENISFTIKQGEVVGLWGLLGSGRTEVARALAGLDPIDSGDIFIRTSGNLKLIKQSEAKKSIGMVTENRREEGLLLPLSVKHNMSLANLKGFTKGVLPFICQKLEQAQTQKYVEHLEIKVSSYNQKVETLSGGNQQKVIVARWLQKNPLIYIMDEPTHGLDVGAKANIRNIIAKLADAGAALLVISSEIEEIMSISDRYLVMKRGRIVAELGRNATKEELMAAAAGVQQEIKA